MNLNYLAPTHQDCSVCEIHANALRVHCMCNGEKPRLNRRPTTLQFMRPFQLAGMHYEFISRIAWIELPTNDHTIIKLHYIALIDDRRPAMLMLCNANKVILQALHCISRRPTTSPAQFLIISKFLSIIAITNDVIGSKISTQTTSLWLFND